MAKRLPRIGLAAAGVWAGSQLPGPVAAAVDSRSPLMTCRWGWARRWPWIAGAIGGRRGLVRRPARSMRCCLFVFRVFNAGFNLLTGGYVATVGLMLAHQRRSCSCLYGGLMVLTYKMFSDTPTGFIPLARQGLFDRQRAACPTRPRSRGPKQTMQRSRRLAGNVAGRQPHRGHRRAIAAAGRQCAELRLDVRHARRISRSSRRAPHGRRDRRPTEGALRERNSRRRGQYLRRPADRRAGHGRRFQDRDRRSRRYRSAGA